VSKEATNETKTPAEMESKKSEAEMTSEEATSLIVAPYVSEKTFNQIEKENKLAFIVSEKAGKNEIKQAIRILYESEVDEVNTTRTIRGKKAFAHFKSPEGARELATKLGLV
jgi:large subunit ribosomal protein L23